MIFPTFLRYELIHPLLFLISDFLQGIYETINITIIIEYLTYTGNINLILNLIID